MRLFVLLTFLASVGLADTAKTANGTVSGTVEDGIAVYRGIPFAAPPVGDLRWHPPQAAAKWSGVRSAEKFAPACVQGGGGAPVKIKPVGSSAGPGLAPAGSTLSTIKTICGELSAPGAATATRP